MADNDTLTYCIKRYDSKVCKRRGYKEKEEPEETLLLLQYIAVGHHHEVFHSSCVVGLCSYR